MITRIILICIVSLSLLVGCGADYGRVKVNNKGFEVEAGVDSDDKQDKPKHCPPGHQKKGWC